MTGLKFGLLLFDHIWFYVNWFKLMPFLTHIRKKFTRLFSKDVHSIF